MNALGETDRAFMKYAYNSTLEKPITHAEYSMKVSYTSGLHV